MLLTIPATVRARSSRPLSSGNNFVASIFQTLLVKPDLERFTLNFQIARPRILLQNRDRPLPAGDFGQRQEPPDGEASRPRDQDGQQDAYRQQVILEAFAGLCAGPVHEETELYVNRGDGSEHDEDD